MPNKPGRKRINNASKRTVYLTAEAEEIYKSQENKSEFISRAVINEAKRKRPARRNPSP